MEGPETVTKHFRVSPDDPSSMMHKALSCVACGYRFDAASLPEHGPAQAPKDGDYSLCFRCGEVQVYVVGALGIAVREATVAELEEFASVPEQVAAVRKIHQFWAEHGGR